MGEFIGIGCYEPDDGGVGAQDDDEEGDGLQDFDDVFLEALPGEGVVEGRGEDGDEEDDIADIPGGADKELLDVDNFVDDEVEGVVNVFSESFEGGVVIHWETPIIVRLFGRRESG